MNFKEISEEIIRLKERDLALRDRLVQEKRLGNGYNAEMAALHSSNARRLSEIIEAIGYPTTEKVGEMASEAAWLIIQHAIGQPEFMRKCVVLLREAVDEGQANTLNLAYLTDRIAVFEGKAQTYGTQFDWDENKEMSPQLIDDLDEVNQRRRAIGLNTLEEQTEIIRARIKKENESPPADFETRKREIEEWKRLIGWKK